MSHPADITVVIPAFNAADSIGGQLEALSQQVDSPAFDIIVADNLSTDGTREAALAWSDRVPGDLRVVRADKTQGPSHARNAGIAAASGSKILLCDADDRVSRNWVGVVARALDEADLVGTWVETDTGRKLGPEYRTMGYLPYTHGSSRGMKRTVWEAIGGFDESFPTGHEEVDFDWRAQEAGFQLTTTTLASSWYVQRRTMRAVRKQRRAYALGWMLLWARFREGRPLPPISFAGSLRRYPEDLLKVVLTLRPNVDPAERRVSWENLGWAEGILEGHWRYRIAGRVPPRQLDHPVVGATAGAGGNTSVSPEENTVSVVIPHYGTPDDTRSLIKQLAGQQGIAKLRVVVVDDCSPRPFLDQDVALTEDENPHGLIVTVVRRESNGGFGSAVNTGLAEVTTPWALVLNSDLDLAQGVVARITERVRGARPTVYSPRVLNEDGTAQWVGRHFPTVRQQVVEWLTPLARYRDRRALHEAVGHDTQAEAPGEHPVDWVMGAAMILPVEAVRSVGGFDERFFMNAEEVDLQRRLREIGVPSAVLGDITVTHASGGSSNPGLRRRWLVASRFLYARKWGGERRLRAALRAATLVNLGHQVLRRAAGRDVAPLRTFREEWALAGLSERGANP